MGRHEAFIGRSSAQRRVIAETAERMPGAFTADDLLRAVREAAPGVGAATVYRAVAAMAEAGFVERVGTHDGAAAYARCRSAAHHHHVVCTSCGATAEAGCDLGEALGALSRACGYELTGHELTLRGICPRCRTKDA